MKILGDQIRNNPDRVLSSIPKVNARLETGQFAFPFVSYCYSFSIIRQITKKKDFAHNAHQCFQLQTICKGFVANDFKKSGKCHFQTTDPLTSFQYWCMTLQKNSKFTSAFIHEYVFCR